MVMPAFLNKIPRRLLILGVIFLVLAAVFGVYQLTCFESTDDAFIDGHVSPISAQVAGRVDQVLVKDNQMVHQGDMLVQIDNRDYIDQREAAQADVLSAQAQLQEAQKDQQRYEQLLARQEISKQEFDHASLRVKDAQATFMRAQAKFDLAKVDVERTTIMAPIDGRVSARSVEQGQYVQVGEPLLSIVSRDVWVTANFKETQLKGMKPGNPVTFSVDAYPGVRFIGHVDSIQDGTGGIFSLLPAQNATGNYIKVVQRVPVKIAIDNLNEDYPLRPGLSVNPRVDLRTTLSLGRDDNSNKG